LELIVTAQFHPALKTEELVLWNW